MFGKKKKAQEQAAAEQQLEKFDKLVEEAKRIEGAAEKLFRLEELKADIQAVIEEKQTDIQDRADGKYTPRYFTGVGIQTPIIIGIGFVTGIAWLMPVLAIPEIYIAHKMGRRSVEKAKKRLEEENTFYLDNLKMLEKLASVLADKVLDEHLDAIAKSTKRDLIFDKFPGVKSRFGDAAAKKMSGSDVMPKPEQNNDGPKA